MREVVIVSAARTPIGKIGGALKGFKATELGGIAIKEAVKRAAIDPSTVDYAYVGQVLSGGCGQIPSRQATVKGGLPYEVPSITIGKVCSSGINAINLANIKIRSGQADTVVAAGMESMSNAPFFLPNMRWGNKMGDVKAKDLMMHDGLWCSFYDRHMAVHGSEVAAEYGISRQAQDEWAVRSQDLAISAIKGGRLKEEIVPVEIKSKKGVAVFDTDEGPREGTTLEELAKLPPVFTKDGSVTAGNAPGVNDGGAALVLMEKEKALALGLKPIATIIDYAEVSQDPKYIATVPGLSTVKLLNKNNLTIDQIKLFEVNEAFAAVALVSGQIAKWNPNRVNVDGGAIAFGHPIGASGARIVMHLAYALRAQGGGYGIAAICSGAAQGDAILIKVD